jgi:hypothetical protein
MAWYEDGKRREDVAALLNVDNVDRITLYRSLAE